LQRVLPSGRILQKRILILIGEITQRTATHCNTLQHAATLCNNLLQRALPSRRILQERILILIDDIPQHWTNAREIRNHTLQRQLNTTR